MSLFTIAAKGGPLMLVLLAVSVAVVFIVVERFIKFNRALRNKDNFLAEVYGHLQSGSIETSIQFCETHPQFPIAAIIAKTLAALELGQEESRRAMETAAAKEVHRLERGLGLLSTFAAIAPLVGFLGTVIGMVDVFMKLEQIGTADIQFLAGGIWVALITTIGGLTVGIFAILFYNYFVDRLEAVGQELGESLDVFLATLRKFK
ncbi:MAG: MotA/TolQ/ExbB proton channel family protein [Candidatus Cloacimonetes bacterium]|nr:MotA/TolQ/ExbB proton channel family protein [Candidatus Cloacimonadota bacterium]